MACASMLSGAVFVVLARVAQRIERHRPKVGVGGSSPSAGTDADALSTHALRDSSVAAGQVIPPRRGRTVRKERADGDSGPR
jgi:hypothetical protein